MTKFLICLVLTLWLTSQVSSFLFDSSTYSPRTPNGKIQFTGPYVNSTLGYSVSAGDVNGDGFSDIMMGGCHPGDMQIDTCTAIVYVLYGSKTNLFQVNLTNISPSQGFTITSAKSLNPFFLYVSTAGDVNGDGIDDIVIGDPFHSSSGAAYVIFGKRGNLPNIDLNNPLAPTQGYKIFGQFDDELGGAVSSAGDVNGDGIADIIIGATDANYGNGRAYIIYGSKNTPSDLELKHLTRTQGIVLIGEYTLGDFGTSVSRAGDVNGDGFDDVIVGADSVYADKRPATGITFVFFGGKNLSDIHTNNLKSSEGIKIIGEGDQDFSGGSVSAAGDVNADGVDDIIIGASNARPKNRNQAGAAYVIFGSKTNFTDIDLDETYDFYNKKLGFKIAGSEGAVLGQVVAGIGDVNGDGIDDVLVSAYRRNEETGAVYVIFGSKNKFYEIDTDKFSSTQGVLIVGDKPGDEFGFAIGNAGDVNGDGMNDFMVGAALANKGGDKYTGAGAVYLILSPVGTSTINV